MNWDNLQLAEGDAGAIAQASQALVRLRIIAHQMVRHPSVELADALLQALDDLAPIVPLAHSLAINAISQARREEQ